MKNRWVHSLIFFLLLSGFFFLTITVASAQEPTPPDDKVNAIARQLYCPVCENTPLDVCPTTACHQWRELIRQMLAEGKTESEIKQYFVDYYGARVLSEPPRTGINWLVYVVPPAAFFAGVYLLFRAFRSWKRLSMEPVEGLNQSPSIGSEPVLPETMKPADDDFVARFEEELRKRK